MNISFIKSSKDSEAGDLQRSLQRELSLVGGLAIAIFTAWSALNHYYGSFQGGIAWLNSSQMAISKTHQHRLKTIQDRSRLLVRLKQPLEMIQSEEVFLQFIQKEGDLHLRQAYGHHSSEMIQKSKDWIKKVYEGNAKPRGFISVQEKIWRGGVSHLGDKWGVLLNIIQLNWLKKSTDISNTEGVVLNQNGKIVTSTFLSTKDEMLFPKLDHLLESQDIKNHQKIRPPITRQPIKKAQLNATYNKIYLSSPYMGIYKMFHVGELEFDSFHKAIALHSPQGEVAGWLWIFVPEDVMLLWPKRGVLGVLFIGMSLILIVLWRTRLNIRNHLAPLTTIINELETLNLSIGGSSTLKPSTHFHDLNHLKRAIIQLKEQVEENNRLEDQLRQSQKMEVIGTLAGGVAHDFNNLLSVILLNSEGIQEDFKSLKKKINQTKIHIEHSLISPITNGEMLKDGLQHIKNTSIDQEEITPVLEHISLLVADQGDWTQMIEEMVLACDQAKILTRQLLSLSRDQRGQNNVFDICESTRTSYKLLQRLISEEIQLDLSISLSELWVVGNENALQQVIMNLVINGRDAIQHSGHLMITLDLHKQEELKIMSAGILKPGNYAKLTVKDTGIGISEDNLPHLFEPFFSSKGKKGTGLGLTIVYTTIIRRLKGAIEVKTKLDEGTTFDIFIPSSSNPKPEDSTEMKLLYTPSADAHIILLEDHSLVRRSLTQTLKTLGFKVTAFSSGPEFLQWFTQQTDLSIVLILSDVVMPEMSGPEVWMKVRKTHPDLPFLFLTGYADDMLNKYEVPTNHSLSKPVSSEQLYKKICELLNYKGSGR